jgi:hypothetical protein
VAPLIAEALVDRCTWESAWRLLERSDAGAAVAAVVLSRLPGPIGPLGPGRLFALASSSNAAHRAAAIAAITHDARTVTADLAATAALAEVDDVDVRAALTTTLERSDVRAFGALHIALILDATHDDVRACGLRLLRRALGATPCPVDVADLLARCARHPCADVRAALLPLAVERRAVAAVVDLARAAVFDSAAAVDDVDLRGPLDALDALDALDVVGGGEGAACADVLAAAAWRGPGSLRAKARSVAAQIPLRASDVAVAAVLAPEHGVDGTVDVDGGRRADGGRSAP